MEPFFLRCETCHARLRVRDERFLGQVQSCPKCGSMVHIIAPASLAATATPPETMPEAAATQSLLSRATAIFHENSLVASIGAGAMLLAGGIVGYLALRGGEEPSAPPTATFAVVEQPAERDDVVPVEGLPVEESQSNDAPADDPPMVQLPAEEPKPVESIAVAEEPAAVEPAIAPVEVPPIETAKPNTAPPRTLTLEPMPSDPKPATVAETVVQSAEYSPTIEVEAVEAEPKPLSPAPPTPPARVTNFSDQLSLPIEKIDLPAMPIGEFVNLMSGMTAVPIKLDIKVLGDVGMSSHSTVTARGENTTAGKLLARVLNEHRLTYVERDGALVVVKAKR